MIEIRNATQFGRGRVLLVSGIKPWVDLRVTLEPLSYREMPDFWTIEVVGRLTGPGLPGLVDFSVALPLESVHARIGIEVAGATKSERRVLDPARSINPIQGRLPC